MSEVLASVHGQLQFAEAKNGALFAVNVALVGGVGAILAADDVGYEFVRFCLTLATFGLGGAALITLASFLPIRGPRRHEFAKGSADTGGNLFYWQTIAEYLPEDYASTFLEACEVRDKPSRLHLDLANQVVINAGIAGRKFGLFELAGWVTLTTVVASLVILAGLFAGNGFHLK